MCTEVGRTQITLSGTRNVACAIFGFRPKKYLECDVAWRGGDSRIRATLGITGDGVRHPISNMVSRPCAIHNEWMANVDGAVAIVHEYVMYFRLPPLEVA